ncbi:MAG: CbiQ family ECF transporter T component [Rhodocyclaceae bacterium]
MHPAVLVTAGCFLLVLLQQLAGIPLAALVTLTTILALARDAARWWRLLRRMRYILLAVCILFLWQTPGTLMLPALGGWSPTVDGATQALMHVLRLVAVVDVVAILMSALSVESWVAGLYVLAMPLRVLGVSPERFAVRMNLVLRDADSPQKRSWREWISDDAASPSREASWRVAWPTARDWLLLAILFVLGTGVLWWLALR